MIPYIAITEIPGFPLPLFGTLVGLGFIFGLLRSIQIGVRHGIAVRTMIDLCVFVIIPAYLGSHVLLIVLYHPEMLLSDPWILVRFDQGVSAFGGLVSAVLAFVVYLRITGQTRRWLLLAEIEVQGFIVGWIFGRLGCTVSHDHPGIITDFFLAVQFPDAPRHDLGFYEFLYTLIVLLPVSLWINKKRFPNGTQSLAFLLLYGLFRLPMDSLRISEIRYFGWTPGQYGSLVLFAVAAWLYWYMRRSEWG